MSHPLLSPLGALLARFLGLGPLASGLAEIVALREKVEALEGEQLRRELEWVETKDQVLRHLKRVQAIKTGREEAKDPTQRMLIAAKFGRGGSE